MNTLSVKYQKRYNVPHIITYYDKSELGNFTDIVNHNDGPYKYREQWYKYEGNKQVPHREGDLPAEILYHPDGTVICERYYLNGLLHRDDDKSAEIYYYYSNNSKFCETWYKNGVYNRENDKPNIIKYDAAGNKIAEVWFGPDGNSYYRYNNKPALIYYHNKNEFVYMEHFLMSYTF